MRAFHACLFLCLVLLVPAFAIFESTEKVKGAGPERSLANLRHVVVWSWQNDDSLMFINPRKVSVASYCGTILLDRQRVKFRPRLNTLFVPDGTFVMPVFRIVTRHPEESINDLALEDAVETITRVVKLRPSPVVQIDFDASVKERQSYLKFLKRLRGSLPADTAISMTALASWSLSDQWLTRGAADEAVVMLFSMGEGQRETLATIRHKHPATCLSKEVSLGFSGREASVIDEIRTTGIIHQADRVYLFASGGWTKARYQNLIREVLN